MLRFHTQRDAEVFSGLVFLVGATILVSYGISADASMFLLAFIAITALLFDQRLGYGALALSILSLAILGWLVLTGVFKLLVVGGTTGVLSDWITYGLDMAVPGAVIVLAVHFLKREFNTVLHQVREIFQALQAEQAQLEERVAQRTSDFGQGESENRRAGFATTNRRRGITIGGRYRGAGSAYEFVDKSHQPAT